QFFEVRRIMEPAAAAMAAVRATDDELGTIRKILGQIDATASADELVANDLEFHRSVAQASGNSVLSSVIDGLSAPTHRARIWRGLTEQGAIERTLSEHQAIYEALAAHQPDV